MEREILIANTKTQKRYKINTDAATLGDLKTVLDNNHIDYSGMSFTEGISNTQLLDDNSQLPTNLNYKGKITNNLVILLTNTTKNIPLGAVSAERAELFDFIKSHNLQTQVMEEFGKNMTQVKTDELKNFVHIYGGEETDDNVPAEPESEEKSELDNIADDILSQHGFNDADSDDRSGHPEDIDELAKFTNIDIVAELIKRLFVDNNLDYSDLETLQNVIRGMLDED